MSSQIEFSSSQSKKAAFYINKFIYSLQHTIPKLFFKLECETSKDTTKILQTKRGYRKMTYHYAKHSVQGIASLDAEAILSSAKKLYLDKDCIKMSSNTFKKNTQCKVPYLPVCENFHEIIEFNLINGNEVNSQQKQIKQTKKLTTLKIKEIQEETVTPQSQIKKLPNNNYELYVIHHCQGENNESQKPMNWASFIQRYHFIDQMDGEQIKSRINYTMIFNYEEQSGIFSFANQQNKLYDIFLGTYLQEKDGQLQNINKLQGFLLQNKDRVQKKLKQLQDPSFQQTHKRWLKLPTQYYKQFTLLKKHTSSYYRSIHQNIDEIPQAFLNNLICRYMHAKQYNYKQSLDCLLEYLKWEQHMSSTYNLNMFAHHHKLDFFTCLGQDYEGRIVILNRASHLNVNLIDNIEDYCIYYIYFLEIFLQKKMKGYSDQFTIIADIQNLSAQNFKLSITKRNLADSLKYSPERQYKLICVNVGLFAYTVWGVLKPMLPKRTLSKINIFGTDRKEIVEALSKQMDISVIPQYLGGKNTRIFTQDLEDEIEMMSQH